MAPFSKLMKKKQSGAADHDDLTPSKPAESEGFSHSQLSRQSLARITEQKIDEIESAIREDYLKLSQAAREASHQERTDNSRTAQAEPVSEPGEEGTQLLNVEEDFQPTILRTDSKYSLFNDDPSD